MAYNDGDDYGGVHPEQLDEPRYGQPGTPPLVYITDPENPRGSWFPVYQRTDDIGMRPGNRRSYAYIGHRTTVLSAAVRSLRRWMTGVNPSPWGAIVWARNRTQIRDDLLACGMPVYFGGRICFPGQLDSGEDMTRIGSSADTHGDLIRSAQASLERAQVVAQQLVEQAAASATAQVEAARKRLSRLMSMPTEPGPDEDGYQPVIRWRMKYGPEGTRVYDYAAARTAAGRWNTTGPKSPKDYSWAELIHWIEQTSPEPVDIHLATGWGDLTSGNDRES